MAGLGTDPQAGSRQDLAIFKGMRRLAAILVAVTLGVAGQASAQAVLGGEIVEASSGQPIETVDVRLLGSGGVIRARVLSDESGRFRIEGLEAGQYILTASRLGYAPIEGEVEVGEGDEIDLEVRLSPDAVVLEAITVVARRPNEWGRLQRFRERAAWVQNFGGGRIYLAEDIERIRPGSVDHLVDTYAWGRCSPTVLINGMTTDGSIFGITPEQIIGIELYRGAETVPPEYYRPGICGMALLWTHNDSAGRKWSWARLGVAGAIVLFVGTVLH